MSLKVRKPVVAGRFYPGEKSKLTDLLDQIFLESTDQKFYKSVNAVIVPHAGYAISGRIAARAFAHVNLNGIQRVIVIGPSHHVGFHGISVAPYDSYRTPLGDVDVDVSACNHLYCSDQLYTRYEEAHRYEHSLEVELPFIQRIAPESKIIPLVTGDLSLQEIREAATRLHDLWDTSTLLVISSDFTHYGEQFGYCPFSKKKASKSLEKLDQGAIHHILQKDTDGFVNYIQETGATICGRIPITILLALMEKCVISAEPHLIDYTNSGKILNDYTNSVSYASILTDNEQGLQYLDASLSLTKKDKQFLLKLARDAIAAKLNNEVVQISDGASQYLYKSGSVFVTLRIDGKLRGCIGSIKPEGSLIDNVIRNAQNAAYDDPRFRPLPADELHKITIEIACLRMSKDITTLDQIILGKHGIILEKEDRRAVFLPQVPIEYGWDKETTLENLSLKAGLNKTAWYQQGTKFSIFETVSFCDDDLNR